MDPSLAGPPFMGRASRRCVQPVHLDPVLRLAASTPALTRRPCPDPDRQGDSYDNAIGRVRDRLVYEAECVRLESSVRTVDDLELRT